MSTRTDSRVARTAAATTETGLKRRQWAQQLAAKYADQGRARNLRRDGLIVGGWTLMASSIALFLADHGATYFTTLGGAVTAGGIITGLVATVAMCLMLVLSARVPVIDRTIGQDRALGLHAKLGKTMVFGLLAHGVLLIAGYAITAAINPFAMFAQLWGTFDFVLACLAMVGFGAVGISSARAVRKKYPYEAWYAIHLLSYAGIAASLPHQFSMSGMLAEGTIGRPFWIAMWLVTAFCMLTFRVFLPLFTTLGHGLRVSRVVPEGPDAVNIEFTGRGLERLGAKGGHWLNWRFLTPELALQPHPFSLSADPTNTTMRVTVRNLGAGTARLMNLAPGTRVAVEGPYGMFTDEARTHGRVVLAGAGIGIAPVRALLESTSFVPGDAVVILRASTPNELYLLDEVRTLCAAKGATLYVLMGRRAGDDAWVDAKHAGLHLTDFAPWASEADVFLCGPNPWMDAFVADAEACGVPAAQIHDERFDW